MKSRSQRRTFFRLIRNRRIESNQREHATGFSFFGAIGVVAIQIAGGADAGIVNLFHAQRATLPDNFRGEIDFVMRRTNTRAELHDRVRGIGAEAINHLRYGVRDNAELGAFASGVYKTDRRRFWIDDVNSTTVSDVDTECDAALIRDQAVAAGEFAAHRAAAAIIDNCDFVSVNLLSGEKRPVADTDRVANFAMRGVEPLQHFGFVMPRRRGVDAGNSMRENVAADSDSAQRGKLFKGQMHS